MTAERGVVVVRNARGPISGRLVGWRYAKCRRCFWFETDQVGTRDIYDLARGHVDWYRRYGPSQW